MQTTTHMPGWTEGLPAAARIQRIARWSRPHTGKDLMKHPQRRLRRLTIAAAALIAVALAVVLGPVGSVSAGSAAGPWTLTFDDPSGDAPGAPDVTNVAIDGTDASGTYTFTVRVANANPGGPDGLIRDVDIWLDTDENPSTGSP